MMKNILSLIFAFFLYVTGSFGQLNTCPGTHCTTNLYTYGCAASFINNFSFASIKNDTSGCNAVPPTDAYCTAFTANVKTGETYKASMQGDPVFATNFLIWIDFDQNNSFDDAGELLYVSPTFGNSVYKTNITIPSTAKTGLTRMRVRSSNSNGGLTGAEGDACKEVTYGEAEDYTLNIESCPANAKISHSDTLAFCEGDSVVLTANEGIHYKWNTGDTTQSIVVKNTGVFTVEVTSANNCKAKDSASVQVSPCDIGIRKNLTEKNFVISPNPAHEFITLKSVKSVIGKVSLLNVIGQEFYLNYVELSPNQLISIDVSTFPVGLYYLKISQPDQVSLIKMLIH